MKTLTISKKRFERAFWFLIALLLVLTLCQMARASTITAEERRWLAKAVYGEVGVMGEHREQAGTWVVHVALNRVEHDWFPSDLVTVIRQGFFGASTGAEPEQWAYDVVDLALEQRSNDEDPTAGSLFLFGGQDIIECMNFSKRRGMLQRDGWVFSVHLFTTWPYPEGCWYE